MWRAALGGAVVVAIVGVSLAGVLLATANNGESESSTTAPQQILPQPTETVALTAATQSSREAQPLQTDRLVAAGIEAETLVLISGPTELSLLDLATGAWSRWDVPEPLVLVNPAALAESVVVVGETKAWVSALGAEFETGPNWRELGAADRVRFSTKPDRVWLRTINEKTRPSDAEYLWSEVDLDGVVHRTMFRNRELYFSTPELVSGIGGDIFRLTDAEINAWRVFSPYGVIVASGPNDLIVKECTNKLACERVWYDATTGDRRASVFTDLAREVEPSYGALLSPDGRFAYWEAEDGSTKIQSVATKTDIANTCEWGLPLAWTGGSEGFACAAGSGVELYETNGGALLGNLSETVTSRFVFATSSPR